MSIQKYTNNCTNKNNVLKLHLFSVPINYAGECRDDSHSFSTSGLSDENSLTECKDKCELNSECVAFSYQMPADPSRWTCIQYKGGPYTSGSGEPGTTCYLFNQGTFCPYYIKIDIIEKNI